MDVWIEFIVEAAAGLVGVFAGAALALWADRRARRHRAEEEQARLEDNLASSRRLVISSVVKNTSEAKKLVQTLNSGDDQYLFRVTMENAVWEATRAQFVRLASVEERVLLTRFFDHVRRLGRLIEFHRNVRADLDVQGAAPEQSDRQLVDDLRKRLKEVASDIRIDGLVIVTDLGDDMHKRLLGIKVETEAPVDS
ncbi:MAG: hypothetical protein AAGH19_00845 [Pseudomonadota bacterium]